MSAGWRSAGERSGESPDAPAGRPLSSPRLLLVFLRPHWRALAGAAGVGLVMSAGSVLGLRLIEEMARTLMSQPGHLPLAHLALAAAALAVLVSAAAYAQHWWSATAALGLAARLRQAATARVLSRSWAWLQRQRIGELLTRLGQDVLLIQHGVERLLPRMLRMALIPVGVIGYLLYLSWPLTLVTTVVVVLASGLMGGLGHLARRRGRRSASRYDTLSASLQETLRNRYTVKCMATEAVECARLHGVEEQYVRRRRAQIRIEGLYRPATALLQLGCLLGLLLFGGELVASGSLGVDQLTAYFAGLGVLVSNFSAFGGLQGELQQAMIAAERLSELLTCAEAERDSEDAVDLPAGLHPVRIEGVGFRHQSGEQAALHEIDLEIAPGEMVAIVGPSGAGKTTVLELLLGLYMPQRGRILIGGVDLVKLRRASLRAGVGMVPQHPELFAGTVSENVGYGSPAASEHQIRQAARAARAEDFILRLPDGYATVLHEGGGNLSAGERQRIAIARAFLRDPPILLLDEPTANLDVHSERLIAEALRRLRQRRTVIMVAHRLAAARSADRIVVLQGGRVVEVGAPGELLRQGGHFHRLYQAHLGAC